MILCPKIVEIQGSYGTNQCFHQLSAGNSRSLEAWFFATSPVNIRQLDVNWIHQLIWVCLKMGYTPNDIAI
jgi:hypothetical protein